jgi:hypothetical protein
MNRITLALFALLTSVGTVAAGTVVIDADTTIDAGDSYPDDNVRVIDGLTPPTVVDIVDGGVIEGLTVEGSSIINMSGGLVRSHFPYVGVSADDSSTVNLSAGLIDGSLALYDLATLDMSGGTVHEELDAFGSGTLHISGGSMGDFFVSGSSAISVTGGILGNVFSCGGSCVVDLFGGFRVGWLNTDQSSIVNLYGGHLDYLNCYGASTLNVYGYDLLLTQDHLTGTLADGSPLDVDVGDDYGRIILHEIPEPSTLLLLSFATVTLLGYSRCRKRSKQ